jgi:hypothetical protein
MELRILAHLSDDRVLSDLMHTAGPKGDVFELIAATLLRKGATACEASPETVTSEERNRAKKVTYGEPEHRHSVSSPNPPGSYPFHPDIIDGVVVSMRREWG